MRSCLRAAGAVLTAALVLASAPAQAQKQTFALDLRDLVGRLIDSDMKQCKSLSGRLTKAIDDPAFERLTPRERSWALYAAIGCSPKDSAQALAAAKRLAPIARDPSLIYAAQLILLIDAAQRNAPGDYVDALARIVEADPAMLDNWPPRAFGWILIATQDDAAQQTRVLTLLHAVPWKTDEAKDADRDYWSLRLAQQLAEGRSDMTKAAALLDGVTDPDGLISVAQDRRFEPLWPALEKAGRFDWTRMAETRLALQKARMAEQPNALRPAMSVIDSLRALRRYDEALAVGEAYAARLRKGEAFTDADEQRNWLLNAYAYVLFDMGRFDEADAVAKASIGDNDGISQNVNRAQMLINAGHPAEALKVVGRVRADQGSSYGLMWVDALKACAQANLGDKAAAQAALDGMRPRSKDNSAALTQALLCLDRQDEAAALYVQRLKDPAERSAALKAFRSGAPSPATPPVAAAFDARQAAVLARPEVQAALKAQGRAITLPLAGEYSGAI